MQTSKSDGIVYEVSWYYFEGYDKHGLFNQEEIIRLNIHSRIDENTDLWNKGN